MAAKERGSCSTFGNAQRDQVGGNDDADGPKFWGRGSRPNQFFCHLRDSAVKFRCRLSAATVTA